MFGLSRKTDYAVVALARLAQRQAERDDSPVSARTLAEADNLPLALLSALLKTMQRAGLVGSVRGVNGGYYLAHRPDRIYLAQVIRVVEGDEPVRLVACCSDEGPSGDPACRHLPQCPITQAIRRLNDRLGLLLERLSLADLLKQTDPDSQQAYAAAN